MAEKIMVISPKNKTVFNFRGDLIKEFINKGYEVVVTGPNDDFVDDIKALGAEFVKVPCVKDNTSILNDLSYCKNLYKVIRKYKPNKIFSYTIKPVIYGSIAGGLAGVKEIYPMMTGLGRVYGIDSLKTRIIRLITGILYKIGFAFCKKVIFQNWDDLELFVKLRYLPRTKCEKIDGSGVNMNRFEFCELPDKPVFLMISRIIKEKGVFEFCEAAKTVKEKYPEAEFVLLGGYDESFGAIKPEQMETYTTAGIVKIPGEVKDVSPVLKDAFCFVLPTYYREGIPRTILEAMATGKPILTTDWVGTREAVEDGENGFLVPIKDSKALGEKMIYMIENKEQTKLMGKASYKICQEKFDVNIINEKMLEFMEI